MAFGISFTNLSMQQLGRWELVSFVGLDNYITIFEDSVFRKSITNTFYYVIIGVPAVILVSFFLAYLLHSGGEKKIFSFFRAVFYSPSVTNMVAISIVWLLILSVWKNMGLNMLIFLAALQSVPRELYEASSLDGAGKWKQLVKITLPNIGFSIFFVTVTTLIGWFQYFEEVYVMTEGGPVNSTISMTYYIYRTGFWSSRFGQAAAASVILFAFIMIATLIQLRVQTRSDD